MNIFKKYLRALTLPLPFGLMHAGQGSRIERPRIVKRAQYISVGSATWIGPGSELTCLENYYGQKLTPRLVIGDGVYIGRNVCVVCVDAITIHDGCVLSNHVYLADNAHGTKLKDGPIMRQKLVLKGAVTIGRNTFVGYRAVIMPGVTLGEHCVVGANSVVTRSFPANSMVAGVPARLIKTYDTNIDEWVAAAIST